MKAKFKIITIALLALFMVTGCASETKTNDGFKVLLLIPGNLGDKSFFDAANSGMKDLAATEGFTTKVIEMSTDENKWEPTFLDAVDEDWNLIITGNAASDLMNRIAEENPEQKFLNFDNSGTTAPSNVYSVTYGTNEGSFLAGAFAALITSSDMELANPDKKIGFLGGMDIPGINDFLVGYIQGAQFVDKDIKVITTYAGSFVDPAAGKELSLSVYNSGVDIAFNVAGQTGHGLIDAANEAKKYAIGVDSDQAKLYMETDPAKASKVLTSVVKQIDKVIVDSAKLAKEDKLEYGKHELLGIKAEAVGLAENEIYETVPKEIRDRIEEIKKSLANGEIEVQSGFKMTTEEISTLRDSVRP